MCAVQDSFKHWTAARYPILYPFTHVCLKAGDHGHPKAARPANPQSFEIRNEKESNMTTETNGAGWTTAAVLVGRLIFAALFIMAGGVEPMDMHGTRTAPSGGRVPPPPAHALSAAGALRPR